MHHVDVRACSTTSRAVQTRNRLAMIVPRNAIHAPAVARLKWSEPDTLVVARYDSKSVRLGGDS